MALRIAISISHVSRSSQYDFRVHAGGDPSEMASLFFNDDYWSRADMTSFGDVIALGNRQNTYLFQRQRWQTVKQAFAYSCAVPLIANNDKAA
jgi:hypothetical protein